MPREMNAENEIFSIKILPDNVTVHVKKGSSLFEAIEKAGISFNSECGGDGTCGKCKVKIISGNYQKHQHIKLSEQDIQNNFQLACQEFELDIPHE